MEKLLTFKDNTAEAIIRKCINFYEMHHQLKPVGSMTRTSSEVSLNLETLQAFDADHPPSLFFTMVRGEFDRLPFANWNELLREAHILAFERVGSFENLRRITRAQIVQGVQTGSGYHYISAIGISLQNTDANYAWSHSLHLAKHLKVPVRAYVEWRNNPKAALPRQRALLSWEPEQG